MHGKVVNSFIVNYIAIKRRYLAFKYEVMKSAFKRDMAQHLNISVNSVKAAYEQLWLRLYLY